MFVNQTMMMIAFTANMLATLPKNSSLQTDSAGFKRQNETTTTLSPEEEENRFDIEDNWYMWRCFEPYGCFYIGSPWSGENRPVSTFPARPDSINPRYLFYTRGDPEQLHEMKIDKHETIRQAAIRRNENFYIIIHGFLDNGDKSWVLVVNLMIRVWALLSNAKIFTLKSKTDTQNAPKNKIKFKI